MTFEGIFLSDYKVYVNVTAGWVDITSYIISPINFSWGSQSSDPLDLVAITGTLDFTLNNADQRFTPNYASVVAGWKKGIGIKVVLEYDGDTYVRWKGNVESIVIEPEQQGYRTVKISAVDWLNYAATNPIINTGVLSNKRGDEIITTLLGLIPIAPAATSLETGENVFPTALDAIGSKTRAMSEFGKIAASECGHIYLKKDKANGETLVFEAATARNGLTSLSLVPYTIADSGYLLKEDGGYLLKEDGGKIVLDVATSFLVDNTMYDLEVSYGDNVINYLTAQANPRRLDAAPVILFQLDKAIPIAIGETVTIEGTYANPSGGGPVSGQDMITPVITTDYLGNVLETGLGADISANLTITITYGSSGFTATVTSTAIGWITKFNCRGFGIYVYNPVQNAVSDDPSIDEFGYYSKTLDQKYQNTIAAGRFFALSIVERERQPRTQLRSISFYPNKSEEVMMAFLNLDCGKLIRVKEEHAEIDGYYFIQAIKIAILLGGLIMCTWFLKEHVVYASSGLTPLALEFGGGHDDTAAVCFDALQPGECGAVPSLITMSAWVYVEDIPLVHTATIMTLGESNWLRLSVDLLGKIRLDGNIHATSPGLWTTGAGAVAADTWYFITVTYDPSSVANDPIVYIDGDVVAISETTAPVGTQLSRREEPIVIGNLKDVTVVTTRPFGGKIKGVRVYHRILSATEITTLYNAGVMDESLVTDGLIFEAPMVKTSELTAYTNLALTADTRVVDNIYCAIGIPRGTVTGRAP